MESLGSELKPKVFNVKGTWSNNCANEPSKFEKETINKTISLDLFLSISVQLDQTRKSQTLTAFG